MVAKNLDYTNFPLSKKDNQTDSFTEGRFVCYLRVFLPILGYNSESHDFPIKPGRKSSISRIFFWLLSLS